MRPDPAGGEAGKAVCPERVQTKVRLPDEARAGAKEGGRG